MKRKIAVLAMGITAALMFTGGCSKQAEGETMPSTVEESQANETEESQSETEKEDETVQETSMSESEHAEGRDEYPVKIWGDILDVADSAITVDNQSEESAQGEIIFNIDPDYTYLIDSATGFPITLEEIQKGKFEAYLGPAMTLSLPPQTTPYMVVVNIPEEGSAPQYVIAADTLKDTEEGKIFETVDGTEYKLSDNVTIIPFLTRNIVVLEDIKEGSRCLLWLNSEGNVEQIVLFAE